MRGPGLKGVRHRRPEVACEAAVVPNYGNQRVARRIVLGLGSVKLPYSTFWGVYANQV